MVRGVLSFFISIKAFNNTYPTFIDANLWDSATFIFNELLVSLVIGYTRQRTDKYKNVEKFNLESYDFNKNYNREPVNYNIVKENPLQELNEPLLGIDKE